jgi:hypothetical protein
MASPTTVKNVGHDSVVQVHKRTDTSPEAQAKRSQAAIDMVLSTLPQDSESPESKFIRGVKYGSQPKRAGASVSGRRKDNPPV